MACGTASHRFNVILYQWRASISSTDLFLRSGDPSEFTARVAWLHDNWPLGGICPFAAKKHIWAVLSCKCVCIIWRVHLDVRKGRFVSEIPNDKTKRPQYTSAKEKKQKPKKKKKKKTNKQTNKHIRHTPWHDTSTRGHGRAYHIWDSTKDLARED
ncbi:hypothetical protein VTI74DRAFT_7980 [Chaetomium olivicolor]